MLRRLRSGEQGFTLVELLVVIVVAGILAAIALPVFLGQQQKGQDASAMSGARSAVSQVETCFVDERDYTRCNDAGDAAMGASGIDWGRITVTASGIGSDLFEVDALSRSDNNFRITKHADGSYERTCTTGGTGACPSTESW